MSSLNNDLNIDSKKEKIKFLAKKNQTIILQFYDKASDLTEPYAYTDMDFCLFRTFPHKQLVYPSILLAQQIECSCTLVWLLSYSNDYYLGLEEKFLKSQGFTLEKFLNVTARYCVDALNESMCDFEKMTSKCSTEENSPKWVFFLKPLNFLFGILETVTRKVIKKGISRVRFH